MNPNQENIPINPNPTPVVPIVQTQTQTPAIPLTPVTPMAPISPITSSDGYLQKHMISVKSAIKKVSKLKVFIYILIFIILALVAVGSLYAFQAPDSIIKKTLINFDKTELYTFNTKVIYSDSKDASTTSSFDISTKIDRSLDKLSMYMNADVDIMSQKVKLETILIGSNFYLKINKADFLEMFLGNSFMNKWVYFSQNDVKNNPLGIKVATTSFDGVDKNALSNQGMKIIDAGVIKFTDSKISFENGKLIRKTYFDIDKDNLITYIDNSIKEYDSDHTGLDAKNMKSLKDYLNKTDIEDAYIITDFFNNSFKSMHVNVMSAATSSIQKLEVDLNSDVLDKSDDQDPVLAPKDFITVEQIIKNIMSVPANTK